MATNFFSDSKSSALGEGFIHPAGSLAPDLERLCMGYRRSVAARYLGSTVERLSEVGTGPYQVSPKIDGQLWFLVVQEGKVILAAPNGRVLSGDLPVLVEARASFGAKATGLTILAGELFVLSKKDRPRVGATVSMLAGGDAAEVDRLCFAAFDIVTDGTLEGEGAHESYKDRLSAMESYLEGGKRARLVTTETVADADGIKAAFEARVEGGKAEGLVVRTPVGRIVKVKPELTLDAVIVGYTQRSDAPEEVGSTLLALQREDGGFQLIGSCGNFGESDVRAKLYAELVEDHVDSNYRYASSRGAMYRFVEPKKIIEIRVHDLQSENTAGDPIKRMTLNYDGGWTAAGNMPSVGLIHPVFVRFRDDKGVNPTDLRMGQVEERCFVDRINDAAQGATLPPSELLKREVYTKVSKGATAVKKLVMWKTNKHEVDDSFPAYVVHLTDYSPSRKDPIKRKVEIAPTLEAAQALYDAQLAANIKRGWNPVEA